MSTDITKYHPFATILKIKMVTIIDPGIGMWPKLVQSDQKTDFGLGEPLSELTMDKDGSSPAMLAGFLSPQILEVHKEMRTKLKK